MRPINEIVIHCTATRADWWRSRTVNQKTDEVRKWHLGRGWSDIGYHYLIDRDGKIAEGRPLERKGAHTKGRNTGSIGIALFGGHGSSENDKFEDNFTPEQDRALRKLISDLKARFGNLKVSGHNEYAAKACPGYKVGPWRKGKAPRGMAGSTTLQATAAGATATVSAGATAVSQLDATAQYMVIGLLGIALLAFLWVGRERIKKFVRGVR